MKSLISKVTWTVLAVMLCTLSACSGQNETRGKQIGKSVDNFEDSLKKKMEQGKETAHNTMQNVDKKTHDLHEKSKEKAHELINKS